MAATVADVTLDPTQYVNLYTLSGITVGKTVRIQNKTNGLVTVQIAATKPASTSFAGYAIRAGEWLPFAIENAGQGLWAIGNGSIGVNDVVTA